MSIKSDDISDPMALGRERMRARRVERLNALLMLSSFLLTLHKSEYAALFRGIAGAAVLLAAHVVFGYDFEITGRVALTMALCIACWLVFRVIQKRREIEQAREEVARRAREIRDLGVLLPRIAGVDPPEEYPAPDPDDDGSSP